MKKEPTSLKTGTGGNYNNNNFESNRDTYNDQHNTYYNPKAQQPGHLA